MGGCDASYVLWAHAESPQNFSVTCIPKLKMIDSYYLEQY